MLVPLQLIRRPEADAEAVSRKQGLVRARCSHANTRDWSPDRFAGSVSFANRHLGTTDGCWPGLPRCHSSWGRPYERGSSAHVKQICAGYERNVDERSAVHLASSINPGTAPCRSGVPRRGRGTCTLTSINPSQTGSCSCYRHSWEVWISFDSLFSRRVTDTTERLLIGMLLGCHSVFDAENTWLSPCHCSNERLNVAANG